MGEEVGVEWGMTINRYKVSFGQGGGVGSVTQCSKIIL